LSMTIALNVMSYGLCALSACLLVHALAGRVGAAICMGLLAAFCVFLPSCTGMETPLYSALILTPLLAWHRQRMGWAFALAGLLPLVRGDGALLLVALYLAMVAQRRAGQLWPLALLALLPLAAWELFSLWPFHSLLPTSF